MHLNVKRHVDAESGSCLLALTTDCLVSPEVIGAPQGDQAAPFGLYLLRELTITLLVHHGVPCKEGFLQTDPSDPGQLFELLDTHNVFTL